MTQLQISPGTNRYVGTRLAFHALAGRSGRGARGASIRDESGATSAEPLAGPATCLFVVALLVLIMVPAGTWGQEPNAKPKKSELPFTPGKNWIRLTADHEVWIDLKKKQVLVGGRVCLRAGLLEMFSCPEGTKEHEAVVAANTPARYVHAGLVALGARPGPPVQFQPDYKPAQGTEIEVTVIWEDQQGEEHRVRAQQWVRHIKTGKALQYPWVFAGSGFWTDEEAGEKFYQADGGEFICVSNFSTAMLDLPVESSDANDTLMFDAFTERIPPRGTRVYLLLTPRLTPAQGVNKPAADTEPAKEPAAKKEAIKKLPSKEPVQPPPKEKAQGPSRGASGASQSLTSSCSCETDSPMGRAHGGLARAESPP